MSKTGLVFASLVMSFAISGYCDVIAYFGDSHVYAWNLDHPELLPTEGADIGCDALDMYLSPKRKCLIFPENLKDESRNVIGGRLVVADICARSIISATPVPGVREFWNRNTLTRDGKTMFVIGTPTDGGCEFQSTSFSCVTQVLQKGDVPAVCSRGPFTGMGSGLSRLGPGTRRA
jgi:hypothetical protein